MSFIDRHIASERIRLHNVCAATLAELKTMRTLTEVLAADHPLYPSITVMERLDSLIDKLEASL